MSKSKLENYKSDNGEYIIPVDWSVFSNVIVTGVNNLEEALTVVKEHLADIPLAVSTTFMDDSYKISAESEEELIDAQGYHKEGVLLDVDATSGKISFTQV